MGLVPAKQVSAEGMFYAARALEIDNTLAQTHVLHNAFLWMDRAAEACDHILTPIQSYPFLDSLRGDPRYTALLRKLKVRPAGQTIAAAER